MFDASTPDVGVFAAVMAEAARVYTPFDAVYADRLLRAAEKSWAWLQENPKPILPAETEGTGAYVYGRDGSQRFWAAAELFKTTGDRAYADYVRTYLDQHAPSIKPLGWENPETYGLLAAAFSDSAPAGLRSQTIRLLTRWADSVVTTVSSSADPWTTSISAFHWASNKTTLDNAVLLLIANSVAPNPRYVDAALDQLHYVLGRNALAKSFVESKYDVKQFYETYMDLQRLNGKVWGLPAWGHPGDGGIVVNEVALAEAGLKAPDYASPSWTMDAFYETAVPGVFVPAGQQDASSPSSTVTRWVRVATFPLASRAL